MVAKLALQGGSAHLFLSSSDMGINASAAGRISTAMHTDTSIKEEQLQQQKTGLWSMKPRTEDPIRSSPGSGG